MSTSRALRAILLPPMAWQPERDAYRDQNGPNPFEVYEAMARQGIETVLIDPGRRPLNPFAGRTTVLEALDPLRALRVLLTERRADIIISVFEGPALPLVLLRRLTAFRVPIVLWDLGLTETWKLRERILDQVVPRVDGIFVLSASQGDYIARRWGRQDVELLGHHVDTGFFNGPPPPADGPLFSIGEDSSRDFETLLAAAGPDGFGAELAIKTRRIAADRTLPPGVRVIRERIEYVALRDLYAQSRFVVMPLQPSLNAGGVSSILEASAMGRALVVSETDAIRDFIVPGETCLAVPPGDVAALRAAILRLLAEPETCARLGANGRRFVEAHFSKPVIADRLATLLRRHVREREGQPAPSAAV